MWRVCVYLSNSKAADHRADNAAHFHQQSLQKTRDVKGPTAALCQVSGTVPVDLPGTPAMETYLYCTFSPYLESYHPGNLDSIQITLNLWNTTSCCNWLKTRIEKH